ncbi:MFS transporter [Streptomyces ipomoeae]|uniref:Transporter, major facilitator family protein n=1 Tax=Streptomyces ipomoeae 91-03 TaxID=698759 RepID=L1L408_9ACTN|nr:MFS transporter [Streptomyces ipomoeae]EKX67445.1 transporter, major facilitator family protein [Streptomyces ipomoeae 91-03]MDX2698203.1 MFS transporter [Streptomyces ipomoeae]MDX2842193.1 MFS transporter [Streptomyces ipomoeae]
MTANSPTSARPGGVITTLALAGIVAAIMQTLVTPLLTELPTILDTSASNASWVITATLLTGAVFGPIGGRLGDLHGKRRMLLVCCVPLVTGSVVCALSSSVVPMIAGRGLQGIGMGVVPLGISLLRDVMAPEKLSGSIALVSASMGIGAGLGLPIAAAVAQYASWRVLFWGAAGLAVLVTTMIWFLVPETPAGAKGQRFDYVGAFALGGGVVCLLLAVSKGADWGWGSATTLGLFVAAAVLLLFWGFWELRTRDPLVDLRTTAHPRVLLTNIASILVGFGMYAQALISPQLLRLPEATGYGLGQSTLAMALWMAPAGLMMMALSPLGGKLTDARGPKFTLITGSVVIATGYGLSLVLMGSTWGLLIVSVVVSAGVGVAYGAMPALIMSTVPLSETASANSFNTLMRALGTSTAAAVVGVVLAQMTTTLGGFTLPSEDGFRVGLMIGGGAALAAAAVAVFIPAARVTAQDTDPGRESTTAEVPAGAA